MAGKETLIIEAGRTERRYCQDVWRCRELFYFLAWLDILERLLEWDAARVGGKSVVRARA